jgi:hypothetical protein
MNETGIKAFETERKSVIQAMAAARVAMAEQAFKNEAKTLPPDLRGTKEAEKNQVVATAQAASQSKIRELGVLVKDLSAFMKNNQGKVGYTGFAPALGVGNPAVRISKPPIELRFPAGSDIDAAKARLNKRGLNLDLDQFLVDSN